MTPTQTQDDAPWKGRFRAATVRIAEIAHSAPDRGLVVTDPSGIQQLHSWSVGDGTLGVLTKKPEGLTFGVLSPDGRWVYYLDDERGNEIGHWVRVPWEGGEPEDVTPALAPYASSDLVISAAGRRLAFNAARSDGFTLYAVDLGPDGEVTAPRILHSTRSLSDVAGVSSDGSIVALASTERSGKPQFSLLALDGESGDWIGELWDGEDTSITDVVFSKMRGDARLVASSNRTGARRPLVWDPRTDERRDLEVADLGGELITWDWADDAEHVLLCQVDRAVQTLHVASVNGGAPRRLHSPPGSYGRYAPGAYFGPYGEIFAVWQDSTTPLQAIALDASTGRRTRTLLPSGAVAPGRPWRSITYESVDGQRIQGWLAVPQGEGPFPTILETHGGPESVTLEVFSPISQAWLDHGFAFLTVNYRGSTTFGREFQQKIWGRPGYWEVRDMVAAREWLIREGIARPEGILLTGWSYGGYLTLQALGVRPELWAGGMAGVAVADFVTEYEDENEILRAYDRAFFGGPPEERMEQYVESSPITYAERVAAPVLIIQGRNDSRCPERQVELYEARMRELGKPIEVVWFEAGHGGSSANAELAIEHQQKMLEFAERVLREGAGVQPHR